MKQQWCIGLALFLSITANITLASMLAGKTVSQKRPNIRVMVERMDALPEKERNAAKQIIREKRPALRAHMENLQDTRREAFLYIASEEYNRAEAEEKLAALRRQSAAFQEAAQTMMLDIADNLSAQQRASLLEKREGTRP